MFIARVEWEKDGPMETVTFYEVDYASCLKDDDGWKLTLKLNPNLEGEGQFRVIYIKDVVKVELIDAGHTIQSWHSNKESG